MFFGAWSSSGEDESRSRTPGSGHLFLFRRSMCAMYESRNRTEYGTLLVRFERSRSGCVVRVSGAPRKGRSAHTGRSRDVSIPIPPPAFPAVRQHHGFQAASRRSPRPPPHPAAGLRGDLRVPAGARVGRARARERGLHQVPRAPRAGAGARQEVDRGLGPAWPAGRTRAATRTRRSTPATASCRSRSHRASRRVRCARCARRWKSSIRSRRTSSG